MRHKKSGRKLNRNSAHRKAMFSNMACSLIKYGRIKTTLPKAKELRRFIEPLITMAGKEDTNAVSRVLFAKLRDKAAVKVLLTEIGPKNIERPGGYLSILKCGFRTGDKALMALVQFSENKIVQDETA